MTVIVTGAGVPSSVTTVASRNADHAAARDPVGGNAALTEAGVVAADGLRLRAHHLDGGVALERRGAVVQAPQAAQRREPPVLLAAAWHLERLDLVGGEPLARRQDRRLALTFLGALQLGREPSDFLGHPTEPSICSSMSRFSSSAYSMGSSRAMGSTNPRTTIAMASSSVSPRLMR